MKQFTHAWLAFMAIKRLKDGNLKESDRKYADNLIEWFMNHKDDVTQGAWYPDAVIKDMAKSHVLKISPQDEGDNKFKKLPKTHYNYQYGKKSPLKKKSFKVDKNDNLPDRCESIAQSVVDHLKLQDSEKKGSPVSPTNNQIALLLFMLSHYIADAHVPFHCDNRKFSEKADIHGRAEQKWEDIIRICYKVDKKSERFVYNKKGYLCRDSAKESKYKNSFLKSVEDELKKRNFLISWGSGNGNVWDFMSATCQYSYLLSYCFIPKGYDHTNVNPYNWTKLSPINLSFDELSVAVLTDAVDSIARVWFQLWRKYLRWKKKSGG